MKMEASSNCAKMLFENHRVKVWDFSLAPQRSETIFHKYPTIRWQVNEGRHQLQVDGGDGGDSASSDTVVSKVADRHVFYVSPATTWAVTNAGSDDYRQIVFELLSETPKYPESKVQELLKSAIYSTNVGTELLFENHLCRVWDFYLEPGQGGGMDSVHHHCLDYVFLCVAPSRLLGLHPETLSETELLFDSISNDSSVTWNDIPESAATDVSYAHGGKNGYDDRPMREYLVELK